MVVVDKSRQPVIVGVGRHTQRPVKDIKDAFTPVGLCAHAARKAAKDTGVADPEALLRDTVAVGTVGMFLEMRWMFNYGERPFTNFSKSVATEIGANPDPDLVWYSYPGGNGPQYMINQFGHLISQGKIPQGPILLGGCEENGTFDRTVRAGNSDEMKPLWEDLSPEVQPKIVNKQPRASKKVGQILAQGYGIGTQSPLKAYPLMENAFAHSIGRPREEHTQAIASLFSRFSAVAAAQPEHSWFPQEKTADQILSTEKGSGNRIINVPYTKNIVARDEVDQSAMVMMMSWAEAERRGIPQEKLIFLHGSGDAYDAEALSLRNDIAECPSMQAAYTEAFRSVGLDINKDVDKIAAFDIYSCFPIAVLMACKHLGIDPMKEDVSRLTITGGLPYHGGPGSNYVSHSVCAMVEKLRTDYFRGKLGIVGANGGLLTEHSVGVYSTTPPENNYSYRNYLEYAPECSLDADKYVSEPTGEAKIISWSVSYKSKPNVPKSAYMIGEMVTGPDKGKRMIAETTKDDMKTINWLLQDSRIGETVRVETGDDAQWLKYKIKKVNFTLATPAASL